MHGHVIEHRERDREYKIRRGFSTFPLPVLFNNKLRETFSKGGLIHLHIALLGTCQNPTV